MATKTQGLNIRTKLMAMVMLLVFISIGVGAVTYYGLSRTINQLDTNLLQELDTAHAIDFQIAKSRRYEKEFFLFSSIEKNEKIINKQQGYHIKLIQNYDKINPLLQSLDATGLAQEVSEKNLELQEKALDLTTTLNMDYANVRKALEPLAQELLDGKSFLEVSDPYSSYKAYVHDLEDHTKELITLLSNMIEQQQNASEHFKEEMLFTLLAVSGGLIIFGVIAGLFVSNRITTPLNKLMEGIEAFGQGEIVEVTAPSKDEFAEIARVFNEAMNRIKGYIKTDEQRLKTEENVINFLEVVSNASDGDLTVRAPVTEDAFGSIADAYNLMVESLAELLTDTSANAQEVGEESRHLLEIFQKMKKGADSQLQHVTDASDAAEETAKAAVQVADKASLAQQAAAKVDNATSLGSEQITRSIEGMQLIRVTVQVINKKMKTLAERLLEIGTISQLISDVSTRTTILAMNASIEAARAGEQGRGFLVISDEIKRLADETSDATKQIGGIIKAIQTEANEVTAALEDETTTVEQQTQIAHETGEALHAINQATNESKLVVTEITELSQEQQNFSQSMVATIRNMADISTKTSALINESAQISEGLNGVSESLLRSLGQFRLQESDEGSNEITVELSPADIVSDTFLSIEDAPDHAKKTPAI